VRWTILTSGEFGLMLLWSVTATDVSIGSSPRSASNQEIVRVQRDLTLSHTLYRMTCVLVVCKVMTL
jgi:hypothetical protein